LKQDCNGLAPINRREDRVTLVKAILRTTIGVTENIFARRTV
jgi:hypothetical protein